MKQATRVGGALSNPPEVSRRQAKRRALAIYFKRRRIGHDRIANVSYYSRLKRNLSLYLQVPPMLMSLKPRYAQFCALLLLAHYRHKAQAICGTLAEIGEFLGVSGRQWGRDHQELARLGLVNVEPRFRKAECIGKGGQLLRNPQTANWYSPGPALRLIWQQFETRFPSRQADGNQSYPQPSRRPEAGRSSEATDQRRVDNLSCRTHRERNTSKTHSVETNKAPELANKGRAKVENILQGLSDSAKTLQWLYDNDSELADKLARQIIGAHIDIST